MYLLLSIETFQYLFNPGVEPGFLGSSAGK